MILAVIACLFYVVIGRDLIALAGAKKDNAVMEVRKDTQQMTKDISTIARSARLASDQSIPGLTSAGAGAQKGDPNDVEALFAKHFTGR